MVRLLLILLIGLVFESTGIVFLKRGMMQNSVPLSSPSPVEGNRVGCSGIAFATNPQDPAGHFFSRRCFLLACLVLMARSDISFLWPLTGLSFVFATVGGDMVPPREGVSGVRWAGVVLIMIGAALISYSEHRTKELPPVDPQVELF